MKTVLILGGGTMQLPAIRIAKSRGWRVAVADGNPNAEAKALADVFLVVDLKDREGMTDAARKLSADGGLDGVFTAGTDFSSTVAWVRERLGLPGISYQTAMRATDKVLMREALRNAGVPCPAFAGWTGEGDPGDLLREVPLPVVVKPVDNMGARGVIRIDRPEDLEPACRKALVLSRSARVIVERHMDGPELSLDAVVYKGEITVCGIADRDIRYPPFFVEMGHTMPTSLPPRTARAVEIVFKAGIKALGIDNGAAKGDIKVTPEGPMVGEIAARLSGGYMSGWTFPYSSGVEVTAAALDIAVGNAPEDLTPRRRHVSAERAFISIPGTVRAVEGDDRARNVPGIRDVFLRAAPGAAVVFPSNNVEKCGNVISAGPSRRGAIRAAGRAIKTIRIVLVPHDAQTDAFLFRFDPADGRSAYSAVGAAALAIERMPGWYGDPASCAPDAPLCAAALSLSGVKGADWHGVRAGEALRMAQDECGIRLVKPSDGGLCLGRVFWRAFLRGGIQGVRYLSDSVRAAASSGSLTSCLEAICGG